MFAGSEPGAGAGKGGGAGGSIREAGGSMGKRAAALEDEYFRRRVSLSLKNRLRITQRYEQIVILYASTTSGVLFDRNHIHKVT
ncbi:hypothetical protein P879_11090 [Paragonimus westermani]|uniref:Uncharacterized protein n=1 Tax=Paragonimus westermani TaxID=34504 RepID=A0A8T0DDB0_9TREM|nr:hypothetical protein P879_11090 [Paragonimus westermani]